jgi:hypothetical protein
MFSILSPAATPKVNGEYTIPKKSQAKKTSTTITNGVARVKEPTNQPSGVPTQNTPKRVWDPGGALASMLKIPPCATIVAYVIYRLDSVHVLSVASSIKGSDTI